MGEWQALPVCTEILAEDISALYGMCLSLNSLSLSVCLSGSFQVLHEQVEIPGTSLKLRYLSSRAPGYRSLLKVTMTQALVPLSLAKVHLMVAVEGHLFQKWFHASPNLAYTFVWDKSDAYGQRVYGLAECVGERRTHTHSNTHVGTCINADLNTIDQTYQYCVTCRCNPTLIGLRTASPPADTLSQKPT